MSPVICTHIVWHCGFIVKYILMPTHISSSVLQNGNSWGKIYQLCCDTYTFCVINIMSLCINSTMDYTLFKGFIFS